LEKALDEVVADGTYEKIYNKWFGPMMKKWSSNHPEVAANTALRRLFFSLGTCAYGFFELTAGAFPMRERGVKQAIREAD
jgi:hypothetical protein